MDSTFSPSRTIRPQRMSFYGFLRLVLINWYWFALSLAVALGFSKLLGSSSAVGYNKYRMAVMTRFPIQPPEYTKIFVGGNSEKEAPLWKHTPAFDAAQIYGWIVSADMIDRAGKREGFEVEYEQRSTFSSRDIYNYIPFRLLFPDALDTDYFTLVAQQKPNGLELSKIKGTYQGQKIEGKDSYTILLPWNSCIETPIGKVILQDNPGWEEYGADGYALDKPIYITRRMITEARIQYDWSMVIENPLPNFLNVIIATAGSARRSKQILDGMLIDLDSLVRHNVALDLDKEQEMIEAALQRLMYPDSISSSLTTESRTGEITDLQDRLARCISNREVLRYDNLIEVTATPTIQPAAIGESSVRSILLLLGLIIPTVLIYYVWILQGRILEPRQLSPFWQNALISTLRLHRKRKIYTDTPETIDTLRFTLQSYQKEDAAGPILLTTPSKSLDAQKRLSKLVEDLAANYSLSGGNKSKIVHLLHACNHATDSLPHARIIEAGYWGSKQFYQDLAPTEGEGKSLNFLIAPSDSVHLLASHVSQIVVVVEQDYSKSPLLSDLEHSLSQDIPSIQVLWVCHGFPSVR